MEFFLKNFHCQNVCLYMWDFDLNKNPKTALETSQNIIGV